MECNRLRTRLREQTKTLHERVESLAGLPTTRTAHAALLAQFYGFIEPWEKRVWHRLAPRESLLQSRRKAELIARDLESLGWSSSQRDAIAVCDRMPSIDSEHAALGSLYVFEGATLGGQILSRHLESTLGLSDGVGYSFFRGYGERTGAMWNAFQREMAAMTPTAGAEDAVVASAVETFERVGDWFSRSGNK